jgi:acyl dehydratase
MRVDGLTMEVNYGSNKVRFPAPLPSGSRVRAGVEVVSLEAFGDGFLCTYRITVERQGSAKPVCVVESLGYLVP